LLVFMASLLFCVGAMAQEWQGAAFRASAGIQWKASSRVSLSAVYQIRTQPNLQGVERNSIAASLKYKFTKWLSVGTGYTFISSYSSGGENKLKNRFSFDISGAVGFGDWKLSLKENFQLNNKCYSINSYQEARNDFNLKNILKVSYQAFEKVVPYASFEARLTLNGAKWCYEYDDLTGTYNNPQFKGYNSVYFSRFKPAVGLEWKMAEHHSIDFRVMCDFLNSQKIKASSDGKELTSISWNNDIKLSTSVGYTFSF